MSESLRLLIAFLFILPATLFAENNKININDQMLQAVRNVEEINKSTPVTPEKNQSEIDLFSNTVPREETVKQAERNSITAESNSP